MAFSQRVKEWVVAIFVPVMLLAAWGSVTAVNAQSDQDRLFVACKIERASIAQLKATSNIARTLGLPVRFDIPTRSEECRP